MEHQTQSAHSHEASLTTRQTAEFLGLSARTVFNLTATGQLPAVKIGAAVRYRPADLREFVAARVG